MSDESQFPVDRRGRPIQPWTAELLEQRLGTISWVNLQFALSFLYGVDLAQCHYRLFRSEDGETTVEVYRPGSWLRGAPIARMVKRSKADDGEWIQDPDRPVPEERR